MGKATVLSLIPEHFRVRLIMAFVLFSGVFGALFVFSIEQSIKTTEDYLLRNYLLGITEQALAQAEPELPSGYAIRSSLLKDKPKWLPDTLPGFIEHHEEESLDRHLYVTNWDHSSVPQILVVELDGTIISDLERQEWPIRWVMLGAAVVLVLVALLVGVGIAYWMARPLLKLAESVSQIDIKATDQPSHSFNLYGLQRRDEIGELSRTLTALLQRMHWVSHQERSFSHHVSHEFRSPLTLIGNALALIKTTNCRDNPVVEKNLQRIESAQLRLRERIELFLSLGSQYADDTSRQNIDLVQQWHSCLQRMQPNMPAPLHISEQFSHPARLETQAVFIQALFENTIRNAFQHGDGSLFVEISPQHFSIKNLYCQASKSTSPHGFGYGLEIIKRVCQKAGWQLSVEQSEHSFVLKVSFQSSS